jgi:hypothetical protein
MRLASTRAAIFKRRSRSVANWAMPIPGFLKPPTLELKHKDARKPADHVQELHSRHSYRPPTSSIPAPLFDPVAAISRTIALDLARSRSYKAENTRTHTQE